MIFEIRYSKEAEEDIFESFLWYETEKPGLNELFLTAIENGTESIKLSPQAYRIRYKKKVRAFVVDQFPFLILYIINGTRLDVISIFNTHRHPKKWKERI